MAARDRFLALDAHCRGLIDYSKPSSDLRLREHFILEWLGLERAKLYWENQLQVMLALLPYLEGAQSQLLEAKENTEVFTYPWTFYERAANPRARASEVDARQAAAAAYRELKEAGEL